MVASTPAAAAPADSAKVDMQDKVKVGPLVLENVSVLLVDRTRHGLSARA